jgi:alanine-glyoxylate transaminase/serine-glyoxylate transaminase/serine-pyruvate transaminase
MYKRRLMVPGPVEVDWEVLNQMSYPQIAHYNDEAIQIYNDCVQSLKKLLRCDRKANVYIIPGSGSVALDSCIGSVVRKEDKILVAINGNFGERLKVQAESFGAEVVEVRVEPGKAIRGEMIKNTIEKNHSIKAILAVHLETTTGVLNPIWEIGTVAKKYDIPLIVDCVSSFGTEEFNMEEWGVSLCGAAVQKGLETPPGLGIIAVSQRGWKAVESGSSPGCGWYLNLLTWRDYSRTNIVRKGVVYPLMVTMPVNNVRALKLSLNNILDEGLENRIERHCRISRIVREGLLQVGFDEFPEKEFSSHVVTAMRNTFGVNISEMINFIKDMYNTEISNGLFGLNNKIFRIGHIGQSASLEYVVPVLFGIEHFLRTKGFSIPKGASLAGIE